MQRREFLKSGAALAGAWPTGPVNNALPPAIPIIDTHIHLFDPDVQGAFRGLRKPTPRSTRLPCPSDTKVLQARLEWLARS